ncbi:hypothetical protein A4G99_23120 [Haladaptatus sp. R4]|uniref:hypothetical protein n=1 Tax=Haladaptatus sp. R4 TaxID=1679489 RepID=UPI0007B4C9BB|nr:hypothetical protein [Haladaptatus sp. R4]KZN26076.1 hypothetical protein A4G99_23120 [Haladaptatus sp. R4]
MTSRSSTTPSFSDQMASTPPAPARRKIVIGLAIQLTNGLTVASGTTCGTKTTRNAQASETIPTVNRIRSRL